MTRIQSDRVDRYTVLNGRRAGDDAITGESMTRYLNISSRRVGGIRFVKIGRLCFSFCVCAQYKPLNRQENE
jgi:hypothetical protein